MSTKNTARSLELAARTRPLPGRSHQNARRALELAGDPSLVYVEGWAVALDYHPEPFEHAWLHNESTGEIIDVTHPEREVAYFAARAWTPQALLHERKIKGIPVIYNDGGRAVPSYQAAVEQALEHMQADELTRSIFARRAH